MKHCNEIGRKFLGSWELLPGIKMAIVFALRHTCGPSCLRSSVFISSSPAVLPFKDFDCFIRFMLDKFFRH